MILGHTNNSITMEMYDFYITSMWQFYKKSKKFCSKTDRTKIKEITNSNFKWSYFSFYFTLIGTRIPKAAIKLIEDIEENLDL